MKLFDHFGYNINNEQEMEPEPTRADVAEGIGHLAELRPPEKRRKAAGETLPLHLRDDQSLMLEFAQGSEKAFGELVRRHQRSVLNYMYRMLRNRHIAEEMTQEVFLALVRNASRYKPLAKFTTYLYTIAGNMVTKEWQKNKRRPKFFSLSGFWHGSSRYDENYDPLEHMADKKSDVTAEFQRGEISEAVNVALKKLPKHQQQAFVLRRFQELSYADISEITKTPVGTVKSRVVRAERALRPHLERFREYI